MNKYLVRNFKWKILVSHKVPAIAGFAAKVYRLEPSQTQPNLTKVCKIGIYFTDQSLNS